MSHGDVVTISVSLFGVDFSNPFRVALMENQTMSVTCRAHLIDIDKVVVVP